MSATLVLRLTGGAANADPNAALGGVSSANAVSGTAMNNIFDDVSAAEAVSGDTEYRAIDVYNSGDATAVGVNIWMGTETSSTDSAIDLGKVTSPLNNTESIADESTAPVGAGITFGHYVVGSKLALPDIAAGAYCRIWLKRIVGAAAGNTASDLGTLNWEYA